MGSFSDLVCHPRGLRIGIIFGKAQGEVGQDGTGRGRWERGPVAT